MRVKSKKRQRIWIFCLIISFMFPYVPGRVSEASIKVKGTDGEYSIVESGSYYLYDEETGESQRYETVGVYDEIEKP